MTTIEERLDPIERQKRIKDEDVEAVIRANKAISKLEAFGLRKGQTLTPHMRTSPTGKKYMAGRGSQRGPEKNVSARGAGAEHPAAEEPGPATAPAGQPGMGPTAIAQRGGVAQNILALGEMVQGIQEQVASANPPMEGQDDVGQFIDQVVGSDPSAPMNSIMNPQAVDRVLQNFAMADREQLAMYGQELEKMPMSATKAYLLDALNKARNTADIEEAALAGEEAPAGGEGVPGEGAGGQKVSVKAGQEGVEVQLDQGAAGAGEAEGGAAERREAATREVKPSQAREQKPQASAGGRPRRESVGQRVRSAKAEMAARMFPGQESEGRGPGVAPSQREEQIPEGYISRAPGTMAPLAEPEEEPEEEPVAPKPYADLTRDEKMQEIKRIYPGATLGFEGAGHPDNLPVYVDPSRSDQHRHAPTGNSEIPENAYHSDDFDHTKYNNPVEEIIDTAGRTVLQEMETRGVLGKAKKDAAAVAAGGIQDNLKHDDFLYLDDRKEDEIINMDVRIRSLKDEMSNYVSDVRYRTYDFGNGIVKEFPSATKYADQKLGMLARVGEVLKDYKVKRGPRISEKTVGDPSAAYTSSNQVSSFWVGMENAGDLVRSGRVRSDYVQKRVLEVYGKTAMPTMKTIFDDGIKEINLNPGMATETQVGYRMDDLIRGLYTSGRGWMSWDAQQELWSDILSGFTTQGGPATLSQQAAMLAYKAIGGVSGLENIIRNNTNLQSQFDRLEEMATTGTIGTALATKEDFEKAYSESVQKRDVEGANRVYGQLLKHFATHKHWSGLDTDEILVAEREWSETINKIHAMRFEQYKESQLKPTEAAIRRFEDETRKYKEAKAEHEKKMLTFAEFQVNAQGEALKEIKELNWPMFSPSVLKDMDYTVLREIAAMLGWPKNSVKDKESALAIIEKGAVLYKPDESRFNPNVDWTAGVAAKINQSKIAKNGPQLQALLVAAKMTGNSKYLAAAQMHIESLGGKKMDIEQLFSQPLKLEKPEKPISPPEMLAKEPGKAVEAPPEFTMQPPSPPKPRKWASLEKRTAVPIHITEFMSQYQKQFGKPWIPPQIPGTSIGAGSIEGREYDVSVQMTRNPNIGFGFWSSVNHQQRIERAIGDVKSVSEAIDLARKGGRVSTPGWDKQAASAYGNNAIEYVWAGDDPTRPDRDIESDDFNVLFIDKLSGKIIGGAWHVHESSIDSEQKDPRTGHRERLDVIDFGMAAVNPLARSIPLTSEGSAVALYDLLSMKAAKRGEKMQSMNVISQTITMASQKLGIGFWEGDEDEMRCAISGSREFFNMLVGDMVDRYQGVDIKRSIIDKEIEKAKTAFADAMRDPMASQKAMMINQRIGRMQDLKAEFLTENVVWGRQAFSNEATTAIANATGILKKFRQKCRMMSGESAYNSMSEDEKMHLLLAHRRVDWDGVLKELKTRFKKEIAEKTKKAEEDLHEAEQNMALGEDPQTKAQYDEAMRKYLASMNDLDEKWLTRIRRLEVLKDAQELMLRQRMVAAPGRSGEQHFPESETGTIMEEPGIKETKGFTTSQLREISSKYWDLKSAQFLDKTKYPADLTPEQEKQAKEENLGKIEKQAEKMTTTAMYKKKPANGGDLIQSVCDYADARGKAEMQDLDKVNLSCSSCGRTLPIHHLLGTPSQPICNRCASTQFYSTMQEDVPDYVKDYQDKYDRYHGVEPPDREVMDNEINDIVDDKFRVV